MTGDGVLGGVQRAIVKWIGLFWPGLLVAAAALAVIFLAHELAVML